MSKAPKGGPDAPSWVTPSRTEIGGSVLVPPLRLIVIAPADVLVSPGVNLTPTFSAAGPMPDAGLTVSQGAFDVAVQLAEPVPFWARRTTWGSVREANAIPVETAAKFRIARSSEKTGPPLTPDWVTVRVCPATDIVVERDVPRRFGATVKSTAPGPVPDTPEVIVTNVALLAADQLQPAGPTTLTELDSPPGPPLNDVSDRAKLHPVFQPMS